MATRTASGISTTARELLLLACGRRRRWRVRGSSMEPEFCDGDLVLIEPTSARNRLTAGDVVIAAHPFKNLDVIKTVDGIHGDRLALSSPGGDGSSRFGLVRRDAVRGRVTLNLTRRRR